MPTHNLISSITVGAGGASSIVFSSIPNTYTDLCIKISVRSNRTSNPNSYMRLYPNGSSTGITLRALTGDGTSVGSQGEGAAQGFVGEINASTSTASTFSNIEIYIPNYAGSSYKSYSVNAALENNASQGFVSIIADLWSNNSAITSIELNDAIGSFVQYSNASLYGIKNS